MYAVSIQNPDSGTTSFYSSDLYLNPPGIWDNIGNSVPVIGVAVGQTVYFNSSCDTTISGYPSVYPSELRTVNVTDPSGFYYFQCAFTPTVIGWLSIGYWDSPASPTSQLETILVGGYTGPFNNNVFPAPVQPTSPGGG